MSTEAFAPTRRSLATQAGALALFGSPASVFAAPPGDDELLRLGAEFDAAWARERSFADILDSCVALDEDPRWKTFDTLFADTAAVVRKIEALPATTLLGLIIKARACHWTHAGEPVEDDFFAFESKPTTDQRIGATIIRDLLALAAPPTRST